MVLEIAKIVRHLHFTTKGGEDFHLLILFSPFIAKEAKPGQFIMLKVSPFLDPFLRRPFSIFFVEGQNIALLYKVVGKGTNLMVNLKEKAKISLLGPLGKGFSLYHQGPQWLVAGGVGIGGVFFLANLLKKEGIKSNFLFGLRYKVDKDLIDLLKEKFGDLIIYTEDGSMGYRGMISKGIYSLYEKERPACIYACGPWPMLNSLALWAKRKNIPMQVSLETYMACGLGACLGCVVNGVDGYKKVCQDGPVFMAEEIKWEK
jgi:dihydroorotate dehydrogenase electron transfer subunit